jgi:radical S-adenosyl methionine domain-containing protein 2
MTLTLGQAQSLPPSVNYHLIQACNMRCRGCFATFHDVVEGGLPRGILPRAETLAITQALAGRFEKITFAGGEPTLCPWLIELIRAAKLGGATTMIVTNGTRLNDAWLGEAKGWLDWVTLSVDSPSAATHETLGRAIHGRAYTPETYEEMTDAVHRSGIRLKVNTVVSALNHHEDFTRHIRRMRPERWKVFQVLPVGGQNEGSVEPLLISGADFNAFIERHRGLEAEGIAVVPEDNDDMTGTYAMVAPNGCFYDNTVGRYRYSRPIRQVGLEAAWSDVAFNHDAFLARGGVYDWRSPDLIPVAEPRVVLR